MFSTNLVQGFIKVLFDFISKLSIIKKWLGSDFGGGGFFRNALQRFVRMQLCIFLSKSSLSPTESLPK